MNIEKVIEYAKHRLTHDLPPNLWYHSLAHTVDVAEAAQRLGQLEGLSQHQIEIVTAAAWLHDIGFVAQYKENEPVAAQIAREVLPNFGFEHEDVEAVAGCIMATMLPQTPKNHLEMIICDADLDYLGRPDFYIIAQTLRREWRDNGFFTKSLKDWYVLQFKFLSGHKYFTTSAINLRNQTKNQHITEITELLNEMAH